MLTQLVHHGIIVPESPIPLGLGIEVRGRLVRLAPPQEEMALAWARKKDTPYVKDAAFAANFMRDFSAALGVEPPLALVEVDFSVCDQVVEAEHQAKEARSAEERKALAKERKAQREALKAEYGYAIVNGQRVELGNYMTEPSGIFMGRGQHPLRGRWKEGARQSDVALNLSPDAPRPQGSWSEIVWQPDSMWVARWTDKLAGKLKYTWLSDTAPVKQQREALKFDKATTLDAQLEVVRAHIQQGLVDPNPRRRMIATACYLIDALCLRVGDEKDPDEADTVGATTLRPEHLTLHDDGVVEFKFLGKDSVEWNKKLKLPVVVLDNLNELIRAARPARAGSDEAKGHPTRALPQLFPDVDSHDVNVYLSSVLPGLTAKVFRTHHATHAVRDSLAQAAVRADQPEYAKWQAAALANLEAAMLCNHTKQATGDWRATRERYRERALKAEERVKHHDEQVPPLTEALATLKEEARVKEAATDSPEKRKKVRETYRKRLEKAQARLAEAKDKRGRAQVAWGKIKAQATLAGKKRTWNLSTSLKSYIDPRVYHAWGQQVQYDVLARYYPTILQRKYAWVRQADQSGGEDDTVHEPLDVRTCMSTDLVAVAELFRAALEAHPQMGLPLEADDIGQRYLPALRKDWRETLVALDEEGQVVGFMVLGSEWRLGEQAALDVFGVVHPVRDDTSLARALATEVIQRMQAYQLQHPKERYALYPRDTRWCAYALALCEALELEIAEEAEEALGDWEKEQADEAADE